MKGKIIKCQKCGKEVVINGTNGKYCEVCKKIAIRESHRKYLAQRRQTITISMSADTDEMMQCCLNCKRANCPGECEELSAISRRG